MVDWLVDRATEVNPIPDEESLSVSEGTICAYEDMRSTMKAVPRITKKWLIDRLFQKYLGKVTKRDLRQKKKEDLLREAGLL